MSGYDPKAHTDAFLAAVRAICAQITAPDRPDGVVAGDGGADSAGSDPQLPYAVVYALAAASFDGTLDDPAADAWPTWQVTYVGATREQAQALQAKVRAQLEGQVLNVAGYGLGALRLHAERAAGRDTTVTPYVYFAVDQYRAFTSPA